MRAKHQCQRLKMLEACQGSLFQMVWQKHLKIWQCPSRYIFHTKGMGNDGGEVLEYYAGDNAIDEMQQDARVKEWLKEVGQPSTQLTSIVRNKEINKTCMLLVHVQRFCTATT